MAVHTSRVGLRSGAKLAFVPSQAHAAKAQFQGTTAASYPAYIGSPLTVSLSGGVALAATCVESAAPIQFNVGVAANYHGSFINPLEFDNGPLLPGPTASDIPYDLNTYATVADALNALLYVSPQITSLTNSVGTVELGSTVSNVTVSWTTNKQMSTETLTDAGDVTGTSSYLAAGPFTSDKTWTLTVGDGTNTAIASTTLAFRLKRYWGVSASTSLDNAGILALSGSEFATSFNKSVSYNCSGGVYPYYAYPASFGTPSNVTVGGLAFSDFTVTAQNFTNASGHTESYNVIRFNNIQTGSNISVVWQ